MDDHSVKEYLILHTNKVSKHMIIAKAKLKSISEYSQSRYITTPRGRETHEEHEKRVWKERCHIDESGHLQIPPNVFANCIKDAAKYLSIKIPGQGKATFTKNFDAGVMCVEPLILPYHIDDIKGEWLYVPSDGKRGGSSRVMKCFPYIPSWSGDVAFTVIDTIITKEVFHKVLNAAGSLIGIGRFRPRNRGWYGRFDVVDLQWEEIE